MIPRTGLIGLKKPLEDPDVHIYEYIQIEDLADVRPVELTSVLELGRWSVPHGCFPEKFAAPEYRRPRLPTNYNKAIKAVEPYDYDEENNLGRDLQELVAMPEFMEVGTHMADRVLKEADVITSLEGLRSLVCFADNGLQQAMQAWSWNFSKKNAAKELDFFRIGRLQGYPQGPLVLGAVYHFDRANPTQGTSKRFLWGNLEGFARMCTGSDTDKRFMEPMIHYRLLSYRLGDLKLVVKVPVRATVPLSDMDSFERPFQGVIFDSGHRLSEGQLWDANLRRRYALMKFADEAIYARVITDNRNFVRMQELTPEDMALDRMDVPFEASLIFGRVEHMLKYFIKNANMPGIRHRPLWVQYVDATFRIISPKFYHEEQDDEELRLLYEARVAKALPPPAPVRI